MPAVAGIAQLADKLETVHARHQHVGHHGVGMGRLGDVQSLAAIGRFQNFVAAVLKD